MSARGPLFCALLSAMVACVSLRATAQVFPTKPVKLVVPFPAGILDAVARLLANELAERCGQPVIVENRPGAGGNIGAQAVAHAPGDGTVFLVGGTEKWSYLSGHLVKW